MIAVGLLGVLAVHHPMILSGFHRIQTDLGDTRLLNDLLEQGWHWASQGSRSRGFWDAPFFHPAANVMAYSDCMLAYGPFYWPFRAAGLAPDAAFAAWMATMTAMNYAAGLLLFHRGLGFGCLGSIAAAGLIAFGSPRVHQVHHPQLLPTFYILIALYALCRIARGPVENLARRTGWWTLFGLASVAQFYGGYYLGWFFGVGLAAATMAAVLSHATRSRIAALARRDAPAVATAATISGLALVPFLSHYLPVARDLGGGFSDMQRLALPLPWSWINAGESNWWWGWIDRRWPVDGLFPEELRLGIGIATTLACGLGFHLSRGWAPARLACATMLLAMIVLTFRTAHIAAAAACFALANLVRIPRWGLAGATTIAAVTIALLAAPLENDVARALALATTAFCFARVWSRRDQPREIAAAATAMTVLGWRGTPVETALILAAVFANLPLAAAILAPSRRRDAALTAVGLWLATSAWMATESRPWIPTQAALGFVAGWWASGRRSLRLGLTPAAAILMLALPPVLTRLGLDSPWLILSPFIPGAQAIRMPSRMVLMLLIPTAVGLASLIERLERDGRRIVAQGLVLVCLLEQVGTTRTFDREEGRRRAANVASRVDPRAVAFYYHGPQGGGDLPYHIQLDAMAAALATGVPTLNGVSGCGPSGWDPLAVAASKDRRAVEQALQRWCDRNGLRRTDVQWIGGP